MIELLVNEIRICLENKCYISALITALILPDICGKAEYQEEKPSRRYIEWCKKYVIERKENIIENNNNHNIPLLTEDIIYNLRNFLLHEGNPNIDTSKFGIIQFKLARYKGKNNVIIDTRTINNIDEYGNKTHIQNTLTINIRGLCDRLCIAAMECYENNKEKFNFINNGIINWSKNL